MVAQAASSKITPSKRGKSLAYKSSLNINTLFMLMTNSMASAALETHAL